MFQCCTSPISELINKADLGRVPSWYWDTDVPNYGVLIFIEACMDIIFKFVYFVHYQITSPLHIAYLSCKQLYEWLCYIQLRWYRSEYFAIAIDTLSNLIFFEIHQICPTPLGPMAQKK